jgi:hypothetical protein
VGVARKQYCAYAWFQVETGRSRWWLKEQDITDVIVGFTGLKIFTWSNTNPFRAAHHALDIGYVAMGFPT